MVLRHEHLECKFDEIRLSLGGDRSNKRILIRNILITRVLEQELKHSRKPAPRKGHG